MNHLKKPPHSTEDTGPERTARRKPSRLATHCHGAGTVSEASPEGSTVHLGLPRTAPF